MKTLLTVLAITLSIGLCVAMPASANLAPVLDESTSVSRVTSTVLSPSHDPAMLPAKTRALVEMDLPEKFTQMQQQMTQLRGQLEMAQYHIKQLEQQQRAMSLHMKRPLQTAMVVGTPAPPIAAVDVNDEEGRYRAAYEQLQQQRYDLAMAQFNDYLAIFPKGKYRANAYYWLGEVYLLRHQDGKAIEAFDQVMTRYPLSHKVPDAMLKKGIALQQQGQVQASQQLHRLLVKKFPTSTAAKLASRQLQQSGGVL